MPMPLQMQLLAAILGALLAQQQLDVGIFHAHLAQPAPEKKECNEKTAIGNAKTKSLAKSKLYYGSTAWRGIHILWVARRAHKIQ